MSERTLADLKQKQALPLEVKILLTRERVRQWIDEYGEDGVYISFSGGKDSTVLLDLVRNRFGYKNVPAVFVDTGLEYPEIRQFVKSFDNVEWLKPKMNFKQVIAKYGYPFISKEVSECVYGARKYLKKVLEQINARQTDRVIPYGYWFQRVTGTGKYQKRANPPSNAEILESAHRGGNGTTTIAKPQNFSDIDLESQKRLTRGGLTTSTESSVDYLNIAEMIVRGGISTSQTNEHKTFSDGETKGLYTLNARTAMLIGKYQVDWDKKKKGLIPSNEQDRSQFSQERYKFLLNAPFEISSECCKVMKKKPIKEYAHRTGRHPMTAQMAEESRLRTQKWIQNGCNGFNLKEPISNPMSFWTEQDVLQYIYENNLPICSVYGEIVKADTDIVGQMDFEDWGFGTGEESHIFKTTGCSRTGCMFCGYGCHLEKEGEGRFERMKFTHPKQYEYIMKPWNQGGLGYKEVIDWINENGNLHIRY